MARSQQEHRQEGEQPAGRGCRPHSCWSVGADRSEVTRWCRWEGGGLQMVQEIWGTRKCSKLGDADGCTTL